MLETTQRDPRRTIAVSIRRSLGYISATARAAAERRAFDTRNSPHAPIAWPALRTGACPPAGASWHPARPQDEPSSVTAYTPTLTFGTGLINAPAAWVSPNHGDIWLATSARGFNQGSLSPRPNGSIWDLTLTADAHPFGRLSVGGSIYGTNNRQAGAHAALLLHRQQADVKWLPSVAIGVRNLGAGGRQDRFVTGDRRAVDVLPASEGAAKALIDGSPTVLRRGHARVHVGRRIARAHGRLRHGTLQDRRRHGRGLQQERHAGRRRLRRHTPGGAAVEDEHHVVAGEERWMGLERGRGLHLRPTHDRPDGDGARGNEGHSRQRAAGQLDQDESGHRLHGLDSGNHPRLAAARRGGGAGARGHLAVFRAGSKRGQALRAVRWPLPPYPHGHDLLPSRFCRE